MKQTFLSLHRRFIKHQLADIGGDGGLCNQIFNGHGLDRNKIFQMFKPVDSPFGWWGYNEDIPMPEGGNNKNVRTEYTPLRHNIILFCAAINGEL